MTSTVGAPAVGPNFKSLANRRFALVGFAPDESASIITALAELGSLSRPFSPPSAPSVTQIESYSAVILNLMSTLRESPWVSNPQLLTRGPLLAIGALDDVNAFSTIEFNAREVLFHPFSTMELAIRLRRCISAATKVGRDSSVDTPLVVIADDDRSIVALISRFLGVQGFDCREARDGRHALELTRSLLPDLLILDVNMPFVNGFDVLSALRSDPSTAAMNILMLTGADRQEDVMRAIDLGANAYLCKPFQPFDFVLRIKELFPGLARARRKDPSSISPNPPASPARPPNRHERG